MYASKLPITKEGQEMHSQNNVPSKIINIYISILFSQNPHWTLQCQALQEPNAQILTMAETGKIFGKF